MNIYHYEIRALQWAVESRKITANTLAEAKAKIAESKYHSDSEHKNTKWSDKGYIIGEDTQMTCVNI